MISLLMSVLIGCASAPRTVSDYCLVAFQIKPTPSEIDRAIEADLIPLLLRIDEHDTLYEDMECKQ